MSSLTDYGEQQVRGQFRGESITWPTNWYIALFTAAGGETGGGTEVSTSGTAYARQSVARATAQWTAASTTNGLMDNVNDITWSQATASWGNIVGVGWFDASSGGNMWIYTPISSTAVGNGQTAKLVAGALSLTVA